MTTGFLALLVAPGKVGLATVLVLIAAVLDGVDGALARHIGGDRAFGAQLDSLADLLCFCIVPAHVMYETVLKDMPVPGLLTSCVFVLAGAWRLARFPLVQQPGHFVGLPTPAAGGLLMLLTLWAPAVAVLLGAALLSALMVSSLRFPTVLGAATMRLGRRGHKPDQRHRRGPAGPCRQHTAERADSALRTPGKGGMPRWGRR
ncbi:MAG: CDP-alcohol phosphatidyltransferase family protein [Actinomycetota bacterium]|nr:CDP-alcohol phosphatidyltransferase family protein [Actinomycetota bacterium]